MLTSSHQPHRSPTLRVGKFADAWLAVTCLVACCICTSASAEELPVVRLVRGDSFPAQLAGIDSDWNVTLDAGENQRIVAAADLVNWGVHRDREGEPLVLLADGSRIVADILEISGEHLTIESDLWSETKLPLPTVRGVMFQPSADPLARDRLAQSILTAAGQDDRVLLKNGDVLRGILVSPEPVPAVGNRVPQPLSVRLETKAGGVTVPVSEIISITFNPALIDAAQPRGMNAWLGFREGTCVRAAKVTPASDRLQIDLVSGGRLETAADDLDRVWKNIDLLWPLGPRVVYLSDLKPAGYKHIPFLELSWPYAADQNVLGGRLRAAGGVYEKGLGTHSTSRLAYQLDGTYSRFEAELAIDQQAGRGGSVVYRVIVNRGTGWQTAYESPVIRGGDPPLPVSFDLQGVRLLALIVDFADRGDQQDYADWLAARVIK